MSMSSPGNMTDRAPSNFDIESLKQTLESEGSVVCPKEGCSQDFKSLWGLKYHLRRCNQQGIRFTCNQCGRTFGSRIILQQHVAICNDIQMTGKILFDFN